ncbi:hypothetical protein LPJ77_001163 [Coemansia sp. RSA 2523]|nr:hypothetical protein LPJ54_000727 [Coemansia sp. RSA 1824]KAJ1810091.1 hypothetical protein LPJ77_001163 [Coemansia sp. RSA 2523]KAJ2149565.1 hypothetical protein J3F82_004521 [Coemansia sp. RSA 637]KAJ2193841.1 hypothetical protein IW144_004247 [Coemansia sp. RSA 522]KAJ2204106.1 hypothetical protein IW145_003644 [Coemansia sp. RSA 521]KAJ2220446.1 hypothetical protein IW143_002254 [Coemansia sp. RSA 520]KAJ2244515.1 hypothetical protein GGH98_004798 [Coemansia sp. RSA 454]KAJ2270048.1 h
MNSSAESLQSVASLEKRGIETRHFSNDPLLFRIDLATFDFYKNLSTTNDKRLMALISRTANVNVTTRLASKRELKHYKEAGHEENTRNVRIKYRTREENLLQSGTFDPVWGLKWLLSSVVLVDSPLFGTADITRLCELATMWIGALTDAGVHEVSDSANELYDVLETGRSELMCVRALGGNLPGRFNTACSLLFGGDFKRLYVDSYAPRWATALQPMSSCADDQAGIGTNAPLSIAEARECVASVVPLDTKCRNCGSYDLRVKEIGSSSNDSGLVPVKVCVFNRQLMQEEGQVLTLLFEQSVAMDMRVGFVIEATLYKLDNGQHFIDSITMVWPSYTPLDYLEVF